MIDKLNELNFGLDNLKIMELYNGILLGYLENGDTQIEEATHQEVIKRIFTDVLTAPECVKQTRILKICFKELIFFH